MAKRNIEVPSTEEVDAFIAKQDEVELVDAPNKKKYYYVTKGMIWEKVSPLLEKYELPTDFIVELESIIKPKERSVKQELTETITSRLANGEISAKEATELLMQLNRKSK